MLTLAAFTGALLVTLWRGRILLATVLRTASRLRRANPVQSLPTTGGGTDPGNARADRFGHARHRLERVHARTRTDHWGSRTLQVAQGFIRLATDLYCLDDLEDILDIHVVAF